MKKEKNQDYRNGYQESWWEHFRDGHGENGGLVTITAFALVFGFAAFIGLCFRFIG